MPTHRVYRQGLHLTRTALNATPPRALASSSAGGFAVAVGSGETHFDGDTCTPEQDDPDLGMDRFELNPARPPTAVSIAGVAGEGQGEHGAFAGVFDDENRDLEAVYRSTAVADLEGEW